jgi:hypothetical protein
MHSLSFCVCVRMAFNDLKAAHPDAHIGTKRLGSKPLVCFLGEAWDAAGSEHSRLRSLLLDLVRGQDVSKVLACGWRRSVPSVCLGLLPCTCNVKNTQQSLPPLRGPTLS